MPVKITYVIPGYILLLIIQDFHLTCNFPFLVMVDSEIGSMKIKLYQD